MAQEQTDSAGQSLKEKITMQHVLIPGTHFWIIPPPGYFFSTSFPGLENYEHETIRFSDIDVHKSPLSSATSDPERLGNAGKKIMDSRNLNISGYPASYTLIQTGPSFMSIVVNITDTGFIAMVTATFRAFDEVALQSIKNSINTLVYEKNKKISPFEGAFFTMNDHGNLLSLAEDQWNKATFTVSGKLQPGLGEPYATVNYVSTDPSTTAVKISDDLLAQQLNGRSDQAMIRKISTRIIDDRTVLEREVYMNGNSGKQLLYQAVILFPDHAIIFQGYASNDFGKSIEEFKNLVSSIRGKTW